MTKTELLKQIESAITETETGEAIIRYDNKWRWWTQKDSQGTCALLRFAIDVEYRSGTLIFVPDRTNKFGEPGNTNRNGEG